MTGSLAEPLGRDEVEQAAKAAHARYVAEGGTWVTWELLNDKDRDDYRRAVRRGEYDRDGNRT